MDSLSRDAAIAAWRQELPHRLARIVAAKLAAPSVEFVGWVHDPITHAEIPVFRVPAAHVATARALGLRVVED